MKFPGKDFRVSVKVAGTYQLLEGETSSSGSYGREFVETTDKAVMPWREGLQGCGLGTQSVKVAGFVRKDIGLAAFQTLQNAAMMGDHVDVKLSNASYTYMEFRGRVVSLTRNGDKNNAEQYDISIEYAGGAAAPPPVGPPVPGYVVWLDAQDSLVIGNPDTVKVRVSNAPLCNPCGVGLWANGDWVLTKDNSGNYTRTGITTEASGITGNITLYPDYLGAGNWLLAIGYSSSPGCGASWGKSQTGVSTTYVGVIGTNWQTFCNGSSYGDMEILSWADNALYDFAKGQQGWAAVVLGFPRATWGGNQWNSVNIIGSHEVRVQLSLSPNETHTSVTVDYTLTSSNSSVVIFENGTQVGASGSLSAGVGTVTVPIASPVSSSALQVMLITQPGGSACSIQKITTARAQTVTAWNDKSGGNRHFTQAVTGNPVSGTDGDGKKFASFNGSQGLAYPTPIAYVPATGVTIAAIFRTSAASGTNHTVVFSEGGSAGTFNGALLGRSPVSSPALRSLFGAGTFGSPGMSATAVVTGSTGRECAIGRVSVADGLDCYQKTGGDGANTPWSQSVPSPTDGRTAVGRDANIGGGSFIGDIYEVIIWNRRLTNAEKVQVAAYLETRYGI